MPVIYSITNLKNGKMYIGKRTGDLTNYWGSGLLIKRALLKYGKDSFKKEILENVEDSASVNIREKYWIKKLSSTVPYGYNICIGGNGGDVTSLHPDKEKILENRRLSKIGKIYRHTDETKRKLSLLNLGKSLSPETKLKISRAGTGRLHTKESKVKISLAGVGRRHTEDAKKIIGSYHKNKVVSHETRLRQRLSALGRVVSEDVRRKISIGNKGKKLSEHQKEILSKAAINRYKDPTAREKLRNILKEKSHKRISSFIPDILFLYRKGAMKTKLMKLYHVANRTISGILKKEGLI